MKKSIFSLVLLLGLPFFSYASEGRRQERTVLQPALDRQVKYPLSYTSLMKAASVENLPLLFAPV